MDDFVKLEKGYMTSFQRQLLQIPYSVTHQNTFTEICILNVFGKRKDTGSLLHAAQKWKVKYPHVLGISSRPN